MAGEDAVGIPLQQYIEQQLADIRRATEIALTASSGEAVSLREHIAAIFEEHRLATEIAEREREKAAQIVRDSLVTQLLAGDLALERHIGEQVAQIKQLITMTAELAEGRFDASEKAILKAEVATERRFESVNEFRAQLTSQTATFATRESQEASKQQMTSLIERNREDIAEQRGAYVPVPAYDSTVAEWTVWRQSVEQRITEETGRTMNRSAVDDLMGPLREKVDAVQSWQFKIAGALILITVILPGVVAFAVYLLTRSAIPVDGLAP